jgi:hypothetical protein
MDQLCKIQKKKIEELERIQEEERRALVKNVKTMQEKGKHFEECPLKQT